MGGKKSGGGRSMASYGPEAKAVRAQETKDLTESGKRLTALHEANTLQSTAAQERAAKYDSGDNKSFGAQLKRREFNDNMNTGKQECKNVITSRPTIKNELQPKPTPTPPAPAKPTLGSGGKRGRRAGGGAVGGAAGSLV